MNTCRVYGRRGRSAKPGTPPAGSSASTSSCSPPFGLGMPREQMVAPGQGARRGLVPGEHDRHHLVAHLRVAHAGAARLFVRGQEQHGEQVAVVFLLPPAGVDDARDHAVEFLFRAAVAAHGGREPEQVPGRTQFFDHAHHGAQGIADAARAAAQVGAEKRAADQHQSQLAEFRRQIHRRAVRPGGHAFAGGVGRDAPVARQPLAMKRGGRPAGAAACGTAAR